MIEVTGIGQVPYDTYKHLVIKLSNSWFMRDDWNNVCIVDGRYYRKVSPLVVQTKKGDFILKRNAVKLNDQWVREDETTVFEGVRYHNNELIRVQPNNKLYPKDHKDIINSKRSGWWLKANIVEAWDNYNGKWGQYPIAQIHTLTDDVTKEPFFEGQAVVIPLHTDKGEKNITVCAYTIITKKVVKIWNGEFVVRKGDVMPGYRYEIAPKAKEELYSIANAYDHFIGEIFLDLSHHTVANYRAQFSEAKENVEYIRAREIVNQCNQNFADLDEDENCAKKINLKFHRNPGNEILFKPKNGPFKPTTYQSTGGLKYTFGLEYEAAAGIVPHEDCETLRLTRVGDGSISADEYTTTVLAGDVGIENLRDVSQVLRREIYVDNKCGLHVHVGGWDTTPENALSMIKLGVLLERELFQIVPPNRAQTKHAASILRYANMAEAAPKDELRYLSHYVFGRGDDNPGGYPPYGAEGVNQQIQLNLYAASRYKWLNLVNAMSRSRSGKTVEFRLFSGTVSFYKSYMQTLICLAFVDYAVKHGDKVAKAFAAKKNLSLATVIASAYPKELAHEVNEFINKRKAKFTK